MAPGGPGGHQSWPDIVTPSIGDSCLLASTSNEASLSAILYKVSSISMRTSPLLPSWRRDQWLVVAVLCVTHLCNGMVVSLQAPFYPAEAERKGATAAQYGLVFGIFELTVFIVSPVIGKLLPKVNNWLSFSLKIFQGARFLFAVAPFAVCTMHMHRQ